MAPCLCEVHIIEGMWIAYDYKNYLTYSQLSRQKILSYKYILKF